MTVLSKPRIPARGLKLVPLDQPGLGQPAAKSIKATNPRPGTETIAPTRCISRLRRETIKATNPRPGTETGTAGPAQLRFCTTPSPNLAIKATNPRPGTETWELLSDNLVSRLYRLHLSKPRIPARGLKRQATSPERHAGVGCQQLSKPRIPARGLKRPLAFARAPLDLVGLSKPRIPARGLKRWSYCG